MREVNLDRKQLDALIREIPAGEDLLRFGITVSGSCMLPFIRHGDMLTVARVPSSRLRVGDILVYRSSAQQLFAHRLVSLKKNNGRIRIETRGDASFGYKEKVAEEQILGRVIRVRRKNKHFNPNLPYHHIMALMWITASPFTTLILYLARKGKSFYSAH